MNDSQKFLFDVVQSALDPELHRDESALEHRRQNLNPSEKAQSFVSALFLGSAGQGLIEQHWLLTHGLKEEQPAFARFLRASIRRELAPLSFLAPLLDDLAPNGLKLVTATLKALTQNFIAETADNTDSAFRIFAWQAVQSMNALCTFEENLSPQRESADEDLQERLASLDPSAHWTETRPSPDEGLLPPSLYRAFDAMDEIFQFRYERDLGMKNDPASPERLYVQGGPGVQTSYATILAALTHLRLPMNGHLIDLGSGYGRLGLVAGLWRSDLRFTGFEYVGHRVDISRASAERAGIANRIQFHQQDLGAADFVIPEADAYYMYDPFSETTYRKVLNQLNRLGRQRPISVVTKADASQWFLQSIREGEWSEPEKLDSGMLLLFRSK